MKQSTATSLTIHAAAILGLIAFAHQPHVARSTSIRIPVVITLPTPPIPLRRIDDSFKDRSTLRRAIELNAAAPQRFVRSADVKPTFVALSATPLSLPPSSTPNVAVAAQAKLAGFGTSTNVGTSVGQVQVGGFGGFGSAPGGNGHQNGSIQVGAFDQPKANEGKPKTIEAVTSPVILFEQKPKYTRAAKENHIEGEVVIRVNLTAQRRVEIISVITGLPYGLRESAVEAAKFTRFDPATRNGVPVDFITNIHVQFSLIDAN